MWVMVVNRVAGALAGLPRSHARTTSITVRGEAGPGSRVSPGYLRVLPAVPYRSQTVLPPRPRTPGPCLAPAWPGQLPGPCEPRAALPHLP